MSEIKELFLNQLPYLADPGAELDKQVANPDSVLVRWLPDIYNTVEFCQNAHHSEDLWTHMKNSYVNGIRYTQDPVFAVGCFLHDIGKLSTRAWSEEKQDWTFHKHDKVDPETYYMPIFRVVGGDGNTARVNRMIREHLYRFYSETKTSTIRRWLAKVTQSGWEDLRLLRIVDRVSNAANHGKPVITQEMLQLDRRVQKLLDSGKPIFYDQMTFNRAEIYDLLGVHGKIELYKQVIWHCLDLVYADPSKNNVEYLREHIINVYCRESPSTI